MCTSQILLCLKTCCLLLDSFLLLSIFSNTLWNQTNKQKKTQKNHQNASPSHGGNCNLFISAGKKKIIPSFQSLPWLKHSTCSPCCTFCLWFALLLAKYIRKCSSACSAAWGCLCGCPHTYAHTHARSNFINKSQSQGWGEGMWCFGREQSSTKGRTSPGSENRGCQSFSAPLNAYEIATAADDTKWETGTPTWGAFPLVHCGEEKSNPSRQTKTRSKLPAYMLYTSNETSLAERGNIFY